MNPEPEIAALKSRISAAEREVALLKQEVMLLEARLPAAPPSAGGPMVGPSVEAAVPPVLPPVLPALANPPPLVATLPPRENPLREWLEPLQLWPPSGDENRETRLAAWWTTRLGAALAVIGIAFFAAYVSRNTSAWVRMLELLGLTTVFLAAGFWTERRLPKFGAVVVGAGLALVYFCAFAAFALPAVKVIESPSVAFGWQLAAVALVFAASWWRNSAVTAAMAVVLGYVAAVFSLRHGAELPALAASLLLNGAAVALRWTRRWEAPSALAVPLAWLLFLSVAFAGGTAAEVSLQTLWAWAALSFGLQFARDWVPAWRGTQLPAARDRVVATVASSLALACGVSVTLSLQHGSLGAFYFVAAGFMLAAAMGWWRVNREEALAAVFFCKAASLLALGIMTECDARTRALVLLGQCAVLIVSAQRSQLRGSRAMAVIVWVAANAMFIWDLPDSGVAVLGAESLAVAGFILAASALAGAHQRWLGAARALYAGAGILLGFVALAWLAGRDVRPWWPMLAGAVGALCVLGAWAGRGRITGVLAAVIVMVAAHVWIVSEDSGAWLWWNELALLGAAAAAAAALMRTNSLAPAENERARRWLSGVTVVTLVLVFARGLDRTEALAASVGVAFGLVAAARRAVGWPMVVAGTLALLVAGCRHGLLLWRDGDAWLCAAAVGAWAVPAWLSAMPAYLETVADERWRGRLPIVQVAVATLFTLAALEASFAPSARLYAFGATLVLLWVVAARTRLALALPAASVIAAVGLRWMLEPRAESGWSDAGPLVFAAAAVAAVPLLVRRFNLAGPAYWGRFAGWLHAAVAMVAVFGFFRNPEGEFYAYATVAWGVAAILLFVAGLFVRTRAYRLVGLAGLALCVGRLFLVDLGSTLHRIVAFVALGVVLLLVGFSYHRFRHLVADEEKALKSPDARSA